MREKVVDSTHAATAVIPDGSSIAIGGFGVVGSPVHLMRSLVDTDVTGLEIIANNAQMYSWGLGPMLEQGRIRRVIASHIGQNKELVSLFLAGGVEVELIPQGSFSEKLRAGGAGIPAFYTRTGAGTPYADSGIPMRMGADGNVVLLSQPHEQREFDGVTYILEFALRPQFALVRAKYGDRLGNLSYGESAQNFNPAMAMAGAHTIAEVEYLVEPGEIDPERIHTPGIYVDTVVEVGTAGKWFEKPLIAAPRPSETEIGDPRRAIARRAARELPAGSIVNLGIGIPTLVADYLEPASQITLHSENGVLGLGPAPQPDEARFDLINAGKQAVTIVPGASFSDSAAAFAMIRGGHVDVSVLGAMQVSASGDIANWASPGRTIAGMGGAMDLVAGVKKVIVTMLHRDSAGRPKIVPECDLPLTGPAVVDCIITELGVLDVTARGLELRELAPGVSLEEFLGATAAPVHVH